MSTNVETMLPVNGTSCASCVAKVEKALRNTEGVATARFNLADGRASVEYDPKRVGLMDLASAIERLGYDVPWDRLEFLVLHRARWRDCRGHQPVMRGSAQNIERGVPASAKAAGAPA